MDFIQADQKRTQLLIQRTSGQISPTQYVAALHALRVTDSNGTRWQPNPQGSGWLRWSGTTWIPGDPPPDVAAPRSQPIQPSGTTGGNPPPPRAKDFKEFRSQLMTVDEFKRVSKEVPLGQRPQKWWDLLSILGGIAAAVIWFFYGSLREGIDFISAILMIAMPIILVWFRADIDERLIPLQQHRKKVSRTVLIGLGIAAPFLTAWILYNILHISQYPLMQANIIVGTLVSYAIVRDPILAQGNAREGRPVPPATISIIFFVLLISLIAIPVMADDCTRDPLNAQDCLRTGGFAEVMAGTVGAGLSVLVNGPIIIQGIAQGSAGAGAVRLPSDHAVVDLNKVSEKEFIPVKDKVITNRLDDWEVKREFNLGLRDTQLWEAKRYDEKAEMYQRWKNIAEYVKFGCDKTIDVLEKFTGLPGKNIAMEYKMATNIYQELSQGIVEGDYSCSHLLSHYGRGLGKGVEEVIVKRLFDEPLDLYKIGDYGKYTIGGIIKSEMFRGDLPKGLINFELGQVKGIIGKNVIDAIKDLSQWKLLLQSGSVS